MRRVLEGRQQIARDVMHLPSCLFNKICGAVTVESRVLTDIQPLEYGEGTEGKCYTANLNACGLHGNYLFKQCNGGLEDAINETIHLHNLYCLGHPNIVQPVITYINNSPHTVVIWNPENSSFSVTMNLITPHPNPTGLTVQERIFVYARLADCLNFIHAHGLRHWDLHTENFIIDENLEPILIDFGGMSDSNPRKYNIQDHKELFGLIVDLQLDEDVYQPFNNWGKIILDSRYSEYPTDIPAICNQLGDLSIGSLSRLEGIVDGIKYCYIYLDGEDIETLDNDQLISTCYNENLRQAQKNHILDL